MDSKAERGRIATAQMLEAGPVVWARVQRYGAEVLGALSVDWSSRPLCGKLSGRTAVDGQVAAFLAM